MFHHGKWRSEGGKEKNVPLVKCRVEVVRHAMCLVWKAKAGC